MDVRIDVREFLGRRRFLESILYGVVGAALTTIVLSFAYVLGQPQ